MTVNNINGLTGNTAVRGESGKAQNNRADLPVATSSQAATADAVSLRDGVGRLQELEASLSRIPEVDSERVSSVKQAIADGSYQVDAGRIAERLSRFEADLSR
ncbi:MAG: flagellar biosynthesis anti-sigma factor FlgM [Chromatiales bacterium]|nr:flagellar biosynthesis anti-sigma factor FlgM [Gammaproteobacteria bacterium]MBW6476640.1 flagellar biosynthesis anti-sigma factor FlgM [Chromatiales bacterium]